MTRNKPETNDLRTAVGSLLDGRMSRRSLLARLIGAGIAAPAASAVLAGILPQTAGAGDETVHGLTGGELTVEFLRRWRVPYVFGLGGSEEVGFLDALVGREDLHYVLALHEGSVLSMADGYARATGRPAFVNLHSVVGASYALGPMVNAFHDRTPLVVTVGRQSTQLRGANAFLESVNLHMLPRDYTRWTWDVLTAASIPETLRRAVLLARIPPGGPTFVTVSKDLWEQPVAESVIVPPERSPVDVEIRPDEGTIESLVELLLAARNPVIIAGREIAAHGATTELVEIAELLGATVAGDVPASHSPAGFPTTHAQYGGLLTLDPELPQQYDLLWSAGGTMFTLFDRASAPPLPAGVTLVHSSIEAGQIGRNYPVDLAVTGHARTTLARVRDALLAQGVAPAAVAERRERAGRRHAARHKRLETLVKDHWDDDPISPERFAVELDRQLAPEAHIVSELATSDLFLWRHINFLQAGRGRRHFTSAGGCLGWGLGAAIGVKIAEPQREVALLVGDGSMQFGIQALWSASRYEVPVAIFVWNNQAYQANRNALHRYRGRSAASGQYIGCYLGAPEIDNVQIARGYGVEAERITRPEDLRAGIARCLSAVGEGRPCLLDVAIQPRLGGAQSTWYDAFSIARLQAGEAV
ncbi:MAG: thiamine pyrophosphate-binding protein [Xanthomonadales bacterium]|nr:thiamine pyrophosphate-binding protein [Xanthomonadales bacterium]